LEDGPEGPAGPDQGEHADGQRQAKRPTRPQPLGQEHQLPLVASWSHATQAVQVSLGEGADAVGLAGDPAGAQHHRGDEDQYGDQEQAGPASDLFDPLVGAAGQIPGKHEPGRPDDPAGRIPWQEGAVGHAGHAGKRRHQRPQDP
jgi:hypothetical protein